MKLIPKIIGSDYKSNAEKKVFNYLKEVSIDGYAFHSVGLPEHEKKSYSEADFIVVTKHGILCLEVKGGQVYCLDGVWEFVDRHGHKNVKNEGPFDQAAGALFSLKTAINKKFNWARKISFAAGVVMPDIDFTYRGVSVIQEILYDNASSVSFKKYIENCHKYWNEKNKANFTEISQEEIEEIKKFIRDDLHFVPTLGSVATSIDEQLVRLTQEQIKILDALEENEKMLINGPAGSGKTLVAMQYALNCASKNKNVLFLTYNKMLGKFLSQTNTNNKLFIKHFHGLISEYIPLDMNKESLSSYYNETMPSQFIKYLSTHKVMQYDVLIIDEGQDLLNAKYFPIYDKLLKKGLYNGNWVFFYDNNQNLFNKNKFDKSMEVLEKYHPVKFKLIKNCRNTEQIAVFNKYISGIEPGSASIEGEKINLIAVDYKNLNIEIDKLLDELLGMGIEKEEIVVLSQYSLNSSIFSAYCGKYKDRIENFTGLSGEKKIKFTTIQAFKGLDSKVVIAVDIKQDNIDGRNVVLYTLFSRARTMLYVVCDSETKDKIRYKIAISI